MKLPNILAKSGIRKWLLQRVSAVVLLAYLIDLGLFFIQNTSITYNTWHALFTQGYFGTFTLFAIASLLIHAWVGLWTVITDYCPKALQTLALLLLAASLLGLFVWTYCIIN